jgi:Zn-dependent protease with chaperone function
MGLSPETLISDPLGRPMNLKEGAWANLFASHPPMATRVAALRAMAFEKAPGSG